ncbi:hypothetical protein [Desulfallas thermosapovorans]|uniref:Uncharacterized protein n=1 Tax=Desulfallas thermosapovorans DSM 6562 TaxID=1121431 RepID=A0A5S4ZP08_9FIRM|nr:hypothetical protein [Desulfallas thermosapovorans]TYO93879.1 hypothetical protein LX24_02563 [Desulfallas thermosapovorans DSM 6562]
MAKIIKEGASYSQREVVDLLVEFSAFKDRVEKKFKILANELDGKNNEHELWVNLYLISTDYSEELINKRQKQTENLQKIS